MTEGSMELLKVRSSFQLSPPSRLSSSLGPLRLLWSLAVERSSRLVLSTRSPLWLSSLLLLVVEMVPKLLMLLLLVQLSLFLKFIDAPMALRTYIKSLKDSM